MALERPPTICFVLAAKDLGLYADMAAVAALAVRRLHPQARIILVTDEPTACAIDHGSHALGNIVSEIIVQTTGTDDPIVSSRHLKTVLRQLVKGDYLYLDNDAIAVRPLDEGSGRREPIWRWPATRTSAAFHRITLADSQSYFRASER